MLEWGGLVRASATWQRRSVFLHRGYLVTLEHRNSPQELASYNIWLNRWVANYDIMLNRWVANLLTHCG